MPFGYGPHNCIGMQFGIMQTKLGIISLLTHYKFTRNSRTRFPVKFDPMYQSNSNMEAQGGIWLDCEKV